MEDGEGWGEDGGEDGAMMVEDGSEDGGGWVEDVVRMVEDGVRMV